MSHKYRCEVCNKFIRPDVFDISVGDKVNFQLSVTKCSANGMSVKVSSRTGKVLSINTGLAEVFAMGNTLRIPLEQLTPIDAPNPLTYAFCGTCECSKSDREPKNGSQ